MLDRVPFGMAGHDETPEKSAELTAHLTTVARAVVTLHGPTASSKNRRVEACRSRPPPPACRSATSAKRVAADAAVSCLACFLSFQSSSILRFFDSSTLTVGTSQLDSEYR